MALITTITELKAVLRVSNLNLDSYLPDFDTAGETYILPVLGSTLYNSLQTAYNGGSLTLMQNNLMKKVRKPLAAIATIEDAGFQNVIITDNGWRQPGTTDGSLAPAFKWQYQEVMQSLWNRYYNGLEELYTFLITNKIALGWNDSNRKKYLITNGADFNEYYTLYHPQRTYYMLGSCMAKVEDKYIKASIGEDFLNQLKNDQAATPTTREIVVLNLLKRAIAHLTIKFACEMLPVRKQEGGFTVLNTSSDANGSRADQQPANDDLIMREMRAAERDGQEYLKEAVAYLNKYAGNSEFFVFYSSEYYDDPTDDEDISPNESKKIFRF
jgi:hypothetical protein